MAEANTAPFNVKSRTVSCCEEVKGEVKEQTADPKEITNAMKELMKSMKTQLIYHNYKPSDKKNPENGEKETKKTWNQFYTNSYCKRTEIRLSEIKDRKKELSAKSLEKQMEARLHKKIKDNFELKHKMEILNEIRERKESMLSEKEFLSKKKAAEALMLHESNVKNVQMMKRMRKRNHKKELSESRESEQESLNDLKFNTFMEEKRKEEKLFTIKARQEIMLKAFSEQKLKTTINLNLKFKKFEGVSSRITHKSQSERNKFKKHSEFETHRPMTSQPEFIIEDFNCSPVIKTQRKYNSLIRKKEPENFTFDVEGIEEGQ